MSKESPQMREDSPGGLFEENWWEFRFNGRQPDRRGYHSSFTHENQ